MDKSNKYQFSIDKNSFADNGEGVISFPHGLTITDDTEQRNGTKYDIPSMDISEYDGKLTANHSSDIQEIVGRSYGLKKKKGKKVTVDGIKFAVKESALANFTYNMMKGGYITDFSIETYGPWPDEEGVYHDAKLVGLSTVVVGNNKSAKMNALALNSIEQAHKDGLDTSTVEKLYLSGDLQNNLQEKMDKKAINSDEEVKETETEEVKEETVEETKTEEPTGDTGMSSEALTKILKEVMVPIQNKLESLEEKVFDKSAKEPAFKKNTANKFTNEIGGMNWKERHGKQINLAWDMLKSGNAEAAKQLNDINKFHVEELQKKGIVSNSMTIADFGNFVISPELLSEIQGFRSDFAPLLSKLDYRETLSLQMAWLKRSGDINMQEVENCDDGADGNLKPISEYTASIQQSNLQELAAVTPVCNSATRFLAADLLGDVSAGYRNDYDRKRAQLFIARLEQAVESTGNEVTYATTSDTNALKSWIETWIIAQEEIMNGVFIFNQKTYGELLKRAIGAGISGPLSGLFTTGDQPLIAGAPYIVVPNELLPTLNTAETKSFTVEGATVTVNHAVFYARLDTFTGRTSGGLNFDLSTEAAYEEGGNVKSAFQRNELVLRGSFFRGGAVKNEDMVAALLSPGVS